MNKVVVVSLNKRFRFYRKKVESIVKKILRLLKKRNCYLEIFLISSQKMKFLNKKFRNKNETTSILTFVEPQNFSHPESKLKPLGEIYLNQSLVISHRSLVNLLAHGLLHLLGYNHQKKSDRIKMETREKFLISNV
jgi:probable rRNA maturation factor